MTMPIARRPRLKKRPHNLHRCSDVQGLINELRANDIDLTSLAYEFVRPSVDIGILVTGTVACGAATEVSDLDVLILLPDSGAFRAKRKSQMFGSPVKYWPARLTNTVDVSLFLSGIELDLCFVVNPRLESSTESPSDASSRAHDEHASNNVFMNRLATGWVVHGQHTVDRWRSYYSTDKLRGRWMTTEFIAAAKDLEDMEAGIGLAEGHVSAIGAAVSTHLLRALLAYNNRYSTSLKYLLSLDRLLATVDQEMRDVLIAGRALAFPALLKDASAERAYFEAVVQYCSRVRGILSREESVADILASLVHDMDIVLDR